MVSQILYKLIYLILLVSNFNNCPLIRTIFSINLDKCLHRSRNFLAKFNYILNVEVEPKLGEIELFRSISIL